MENASKALLMAAEILVGILLLSLAASLFYIFSNYQSEIQSNKNDKELYEFNTEFQVYENVTLTPQDVLSIYNLVNNYNEKFQYTQINLTVDGGVSNIKNSNVFLNSEIKYKMNPIQYDDTGKVSKITIKKIN